MNGFFTTKDNFENIIKSVLREFDEITLVDTGWTNFVYKVKKCNQKYVFRFPRNMFFSSVLSKEVAFNNFIKDKLSIETPNLNLFYHNNRPFSMHKEIPGKSMSEVYKILTLEEKHKIAKQVSYFIYELQHLDMTDLNLNLITTSEFLKELSKVDDQDYDLTKLNPLIDLERSDLVLSHADLNPGNILLDENHNVCGILDFAFVSFTSSLNDMARLIGRLPDDYYDIMLEEYNKVFDIDVDKNAVDEIIKVWNHVEYHYMIYMKNNHPEIKF